jgi:putative transposase
MCETRVRYGYRRVDVLLQGDGWDVNVKRNDRLHRQLSLRLRNKTSKCRVKATLRDGRTDALQVNETWVMDFVHDQLATGCKICVLRSSIPSVIFASRRSAFSYRGEDVVLTLIRICKTVGFPKKITLRILQGIAGQACGNSS